MNSLSCRSDLWNRNRGCLGHITSPIRVCTFFTFASGLPARNNQSANRAVPSCTSDLDAGTRCRIECVICLLDLNPYRRNFGVGHNSGEIVLCIISGIFEANIRYECTCRQVRFEHILRQGDICDRCGGSVDRPYCHFLRLGVQKKRKRTEQQQ